MENDEVDLVRVAEIIWQKKKQILLHTALLVACVGLVTYFLPRLHETSMTAFVYPSENSILEKQKIFPEEYYNQFPRTPKILNEVLEKLPREIKFDANISPLEHLSSMLRVETKITKATKDLTGSALMLTYYVRHTDPFIVFQIAKAWREILTEKISQAEEDEISRKHHEIEKQFELSKANWEAAKAKLVELEKRYSIGSKKLELQSKERLILQRYADYELFKSKMSAEKNGTARIRMIDQYQAKILRLEEDYSKVKDSLDAHKRLLGLQPRTITLSDTDKSQLGNKKMVLNPVYMDLQNKIVANEVRLKTLSSQKTRLERLAKGLQVEISKAKPVIQTHGFSQNNAQAIILRNQIKQYEKEAVELEKQVSEKKREHANLVGEEAASLKLFNTASEKLEEVKRLQSEKTKSFSFASAALEPVVPLGYPMEVIIFTAMMIGVPLSIFLALLQVRFGGHSEEKTEKKLADSQSLEEHYDEIEPIRSRFNEQEVTTPSFAKARNSRFSSVVESVSFVEER